ncbi:MAG: polyprenyl diphosphate synthase [Bacilli bacterium]|nr:polyprenyl diphosphate synthase [Bacilli bacterium]MDD3895785.1 polyprenyl diphosphate synthase [Bacilli bacterium]MDD4407689.1 polyprenyl diphosphate synthase [Bacilli bacterium]
MKELIVPTHVGIIMDGNRRWAKEQDKKPIEGHLAGANRIIELAKYIINQKKVKYLSVFAFSTENFGRSEEEVNYLMGLIVKFFKERLNELKESNIKVIFSGRNKPLPKNVQKVIADVTALTKNNTSGILNVCLNYGSRTEIIDAINKLIESNKKVTEEEFSNYLYHNLPDLDFVIRTSGEHRLSNFMLWQASYAELYFPKVYFPDFDEKEFDLAILEYNNRNRRFGGN